MTIKKLLLASTVALLPVVIIPAAVGGQGRGNDFRVTNLAGRLEDSRRTLRERGYVESGNRDRIDRMIAEPQRFKWVHITNEDIGEPGCRQVHARPRFGFMGLLMDWWRIRISSGCPLCMHSEDQRRWP